MIAKVASLFTGLCITVLSFCVHASSIPVVYHTPEVPPVFYAETTYQAGWDIDMSPFAGGEDLLFALRCIERVEGYFFKDSLSRTSKTFVARFWRLSELVATWLPLNYLAIVADHEVFGHGYRIRDLGNDRARVNGYGIGIPIPYGSGGGETTYQVTTEYTSSDASSVAMAGVESTAILAQLTKFKWLASGKVDPRQTALYLFGQYDLPLYVGNLHASNAQDLNGHDINDYIQTLNLTYTDSSLSVGNLYTYSLVNLADAFTYYSLYAWGKYVLSGTESGIPMIPILGAGWLPGARMGLTPFGPEFFLENWLLKDEIPYSFYLKAGSHSNNQYYGLGFFAPTLWKIAQWSFGARFDTWFQPKYLENQGNVSLQEALELPPAEPIYSSSEQHEKIGGAAASVLIAYQLKGRSGLQLELGGKSKGFLPGNALNGAAIARVYYSLVF